MIIYSVNAYIRSKNVYEIIAYYFDKECAEQHLELIRFIGERWWRSGDEYHDQYVQLTHDHVFSDFTIKEHVVYRHVDEFMEMK